MAAEDCRKIRAGKKKATSEPSCSRSNAQSPPSDNSRLENLVPVLSAAVSAAHSFLVRHEPHLLPSQTLSLESHLSSASTSLSTLSSLLPHLKPFKPLPPPSAPPSSASWFGRLLSEGSDDRLWIDAFRMSRESFSLLLRILAPSLKQSLASVPPNAALAAALFRLAHGASYKAVGRLFGLDSASSCRAFFVACKAVHDKLGSIFEFRSDSDMGRVMVGFGFMSLPNCCGVLGLSRFLVEGKSMGKDGALMVQALVDWEGRFLDVSAGWPSTLSPESILRQTKLFLGVEESRVLLNGDCYVLSNGDSIPQYILGDSCFPLLPWLLTPYSRSKGSSLSSVHKSFNSVHARGRKLASVAFQKLRTRWQLLSKPWKEECIESLPFVVVTGCLLHNFLIKCGQPMMDEDVECPKEEQLPVFEGEVSENGARVRHALALHIGREGHRR